MPIFAIIEGMDIKDVVFCTYFDKAFLQKGLALHSSIIRYNPDAKLYILAFDAYTERILKRMKLRGVHVISLKEFEDKELLTAKKNRNKIEYIWTCTPSLPLYIFKTVPKTKYVVYLDADLYFYSDISEAVSEIGNKSILAVGHRFPKGLEHLALDSGFFNVAFNIFKNDSTGIRCLKRWRKQCIDWCYWRKEGNKLGDQMYLDEWPKIYKDKLVVSKNKGLDVAPWNVSQYKIKNKGDYVYVDADKLSCYHFHQFQILGPKNFSRILGYTLSKDVIRYIYQPYEKELSKQYLKIREFDTDFVIDKPKYEGNKTQIFRQKMARYFGPLYWGLKGLFVKKNG